MSDKDEDFEKIGNTVIEKDIENKQSYTLTSSSEVVKWHITVDFGYPIPENGPIKIVDQVNPDLTIERVEIKDDTGKSVLNDGKLSIKENKVVFEINKKENSYSFLANRSYKMTISTKLNGVNESN